MTGFLAPPVNPPVYLRTMHRRQFGGFLWVCFVLFYHLGDKNGITVFPYFVLFLYFLELYLDSKFDTKSVGTFLFKFGSYFQR